jgi:hypothetical protein
MSPAAAPLQELREAATHLEEAVATAQAVVFGMRGGLREIDIHEDNPAAEELVQIARLRELAENSLRQARTLLLHVRYLAKKATDELPGGSPP